MNLDISANKSRSLSSEPGIPELSKLYYDKYDFDKGGFTGMTEKMRTGVYLEDVRKFYKVFTGENSVPENIQTFSDIPLRSFHTSKGCKSGGPYLNEYRGSVKDRLFKQYADHINKMMETTEQNQNKLLTQIDRLFVFNVNPITNAREVTIMPNLTDIELQKIVDDTRKIIIDLYIKCETDFLTGLEIFEAIVEKQIMDTSRVQIQELQNIVDAKLANSDLLEASTEKKEPQTASFEKTASAPSKSPTENQSPPADNTSIFSKIVNPISTFVAPIKRKFESAPETVIDKPSNEPIDVPATVPVTDKPSNEPIDVPATVPATVPVIDKPDVPINKPVIDKPDVPINNPDVPINKPDMPIVKTIP
jgi:hypothetical protein